MGAYPLAVVGPAFLETLKPGVYLQGQTAVTTSATLGNGNLRLMPFYSPVPFHISQVGGEYTVAGDAASVLHIGGYADDGTGYPGALIVDAGSFNTGGTPGVNMISLAAPVQVPAGLSWWGGAVQGVTVTQPTIRTAIPVPGFIAGGNTVPSAGQFTSGYLSSSITGAMPAVFQSYVGNVQSGAPRVILLVSSVP